MRIKVFDTTLRDGEQTPGISLTPNKKLNIANYLVDIGVDYIEAGSAITSKGERESIKTITSQGFETEILSFSRPLTQDIDLCLDCDVDGVNLVVPTSDLHIFKKLNSNHHDLLNLSNNAIEYCKDHGLTVELSAEDASRTSIDFLNKVFSEGVSRGVDRLCVCDTVGILTPESSFDLFSKFDFDVPVACHCHNDFGLAVANTLSAIKGGATEFHSTINGIGERAGNASFEELIVSIDRLYPEFDTGVEINKLYSISRLVSRLTGMYMQPNKAIVGENAFSHESGIHSDAIIKSSDTYEPITPELVGRKRKFIMGKHTGTHGLDDYLKSIGVNANKNQVQQICDNIKDLADKGKHVTDVDVYAIANNVLEIDHEDKIKLLEINIVSGNKIRPTASVKLLIDDKEFLEAGVGVGPVDAAINAIKKCVKEHADVELEEYHVDAITGGTDALIDVIVKLKKDGRFISARGTEPDIINASVKAYISGINRLLQ